MGDSDLPSDIEDLIEKKVEEKLSEKKEKSKEDRKQENKGISRRNFLKKLGTGIAGIGALSLTPALSRMKITGNSIIEDGSPAFMDLSGSNKMKGNLKLNSNDIVDSGTTVWDSSNSHIPSKNIQTSDLNPPITKKESIETFSESNVTVTHSSTKVGGAKPQSISLAGTYAYNVKDGSIGSSFDISTNTQYPNGVTWNGDGTKIYTADDGNSAIHEYTLSTAYDITTASYNQSLDVSNESGAYTHIVFWNGDGTTLYVGREDNGDVYYYNCSTAYDIGTASLNSNAPFTLSEPSYTTGFDWNSDGTKFYVADWSNNNIYEYSCSTAYDPTTHSYVQSLDVSNWTSECSGVAISDNGHKLVFTHGTNPTGTEQFELSTAGDISTATHEGQIDHNDSHGIIFGPNGEKAVYTDDANTDLVEIDIVTTNSGSAVIEMDEPHQNRSGWDRASYLATAENETVNTYIAYNDGSGWTRTNSGNPISQDYDLDSDGNISASDRIRFEVEISRTNSYNNPSLDAVFRRYNV